MENNQFTIKLYDIIISKKCAEDLTKINEIFLVMEYVPYSML